MNRDLQIAPVEIISDFELALPLFIPCNFSIKYLWVWQMQSLFVVLDLLI